MQPILAFTQQAGTVEVIPCLIPPCPEQRVGRGVGYAPGLGLAVNVPEARLPAGLADAHVGVLAQAAYGPTDVVEFRYGVEAGAAVRVTPGLALGAGVQATRYAQKLSTGGWGVRRTSVAPLARVLYTPRRTASRSAETSGVAFSVGTGFSTGFRAGAIQTDLRVGVPLGAAGLVVEPSLGWTEAFAYDGPPLICVPSPPGPHDACPIPRADGADALTLGASLTWHRGPTSWHGIGLADVHVGVGADLVSPATQANEYRFRMIGGMSVPVAPHLAIGAELQGSVYSREAVSRDRDLFTLAPTLRLIVGG